MRNKPTVETREESRAHRGGSKGAAETARDISARNYEGSWSFLAERFGESIGPWLPEPVEARVGTEGEEAEDSSVE